MCKNNSFFYPEFEGKKTRFLQTSSSGFICHDPEKSYGKLGIFTTVQKVGGQGDVGCGNHSSRLCCSKQGVFRFFSFFPISMGALSI